MCACLVTDQSLFQAPTQGLGGSTHRQTATRQLEAKGVRGQIVDVADGLLTPKTAFDIEVFMVLRKTKLMLSEKNAFKTKIDVVGGKFLRAKEASE